MKKLFYLILLLGLTVACESDEIEFLDDEIARVEQESKDRDTDIVSALNSAINALNAAIKTEADIRAAQIQGLAELLQATKATLTAMIAAEELARIKGDADLAADLKSSIEILQSALDAEEAARIAGDQANADALARAVTELSAGIAAESKARAAGDNAHADALADAIDDLSGQISVNADDIVNIDAYTEVLTDLIEGNTDRIEALETAIEEIDEALTNLSAADSDLYEDVLELRNLIATTSSTLEADYVSRIGSVISSVANAIAKSDTGDNNLADAISGLNKGLLAQIKAIQDSIVADDDSALQAAIDALQAQADDLIAALEEQSIETETYEGKLHRLFTEAGYTVGDKITKGEVVITIFADYYILLVDGISIGSDGNPLSGDAQSDFNTIDLRATKGVNRLVWEPLTDIFYDKLEWVNDEVVDGIYIETLTGDVTYRLDNTTDEFIDATIDGVTYTDIDEAIAAAEAFEFVDPRVPTILGILSDKGFTNSAGTEAGTYTADNYSETVILALNTDGSFQKLNINSSGFYNYDDAVSRLNALTPVELSTVFSFVSPISETPGYTYGVQFLLTGLNPSLFETGITIEANFTDTPYFALGGQITTGGGYVADDLETITATVTHEDYEGFVTATFDNPNFKPELSTVIGIRYRTSATNNPVIIDYNGEINTEVFFDNVNVTINGNTVANVNITNIGDVFYYNTTEERLVGTITSPSFRGTVDIDTANPNYVEPMATTVDLAAAVRAKQNAGIITDISSQGTSGPGTYEQYGSYPGHIVILYFNADGAFIDGNVIPAGGSGTITSDTNELLDRINALQ